MTLRLHGTSIAVAGNAMLLRGAPGSGKSDLALRLIYGVFADWPRPLLVADDQVNVVPSTDGQMLTISCPPTIAGKIEVRGLGLIHVPHVSSARLCLVVDLLAPEKIPRMPPDGDRVLLCDVAVALLALSPYDASAPLKALLALKNVVRAENLNQGE